MAFINQWLDPTRRFERHYAEYLMARFRFFLWPGGTRLALDSAMVPVRGLEAALAAHRRVLLTGGAGAGKSAALAQLAVAHARALARGGATARVPIWLSAHDAALPRAKDFPETLNLGSALEAQCPRGFFSGAFASGRALLLVDDLDAIAPDESEAWLKDGLGIPLSVPVVASARTALPGFAEFPLSGWNDVDLRAFARNWEASSAEAFLAALKASGVPRGLASHPFSLSLLRLVRKEGQPLPVTRAALFNAFVQQVLGDGDELPRMLEELALAHQSGRAVSNGVLSKGHGFLKAGKNRTVDFTHELWEALFAARAWRRTADPGRLLDLLPSPCAQETVLFYAGLGDSDDVVRALVERGDWYLAGRAAAHARALRPDLRDLVTRELVRRAWEGSAQAISALAELNSDAVVDELAARLKDRDPAVRRRAALVLGQLRADRAVEYLLPHLRDGDGEVRDKVIEALGRAPTSRVVEPLLVALRGDSRGGRGDTRLRAAAARALGQVGADKAVPALVVDLQTGEPEVRAAAAEALKSIPSPLSLEPLRGLAATGDELARRYAAEVLEAVDGGHPVTGRLPIS